ncbi:hypothetical protein QJS10_CPB12g01128 [Acorus calamus]|uniref:Uncharacterized protein n=1 Tax=Acorus calamus TaxID=4465 RepID=A0AAV9DPB8_ACOCL|nr:hypothetical protein QJS10_CPB12g01128 [Acorus calamus]
MCASEMMMSQETQGAAEVQASSQVSHESQGDKQDNQCTDAPTADSGSVSISNNESKKVSHEDIELVQNLIERCLQLYMDKGDVVRTLLTRARIEPGFTTLVWQKLEEENSDFFRAYYTRLKLKKHIVTFNQLLEHHYHTMKYPVPPKVPLAPIQNGIHPMPVNNLPLGYPILQQPPMPATGQPHLDPMGCGLSSCHVVNGVPAPGNFHPIRMDSGNDMTLDNGHGNLAPAVPPCNGMSSVSEMAVSPTSVASSGHFPFTPAEISGIGVDTAALDAGFTSDVVNSDPLQLGPDVGCGISRESLRSLAQDIPWNFSLSDLTADLDDLGDLGNYTGSPFLPSDSEMLLESPGQDDNMVDEFFADSITAPCDSIMMPCPPSNEEKP